MRLQMLTFVDNLDAPISRAFCNAKPLISLIVFKLDLAAKQKISLLYQCLSRRGLHAKLLIFFD
jgi:ethanolamine utilization protein EutP (predicted NTPase)